MANNRNDEEAALSMSRFSGNVGNSSAADMLPQQHPSRISQRCLPSSGVLTPIFSDCHGSQLRGLRSDCTAGTITNNCFRILLASAQSWPHGRVNRL